MRHKTGMPISLLEEGMLDGSGILTSNENCSTAYGLPDETIQLFLAIAAAGEKGLSITRIPKNLKAELNTHLLPLELQNLVMWERNTRGRLAFLVLTWKGEETLQAAKTKPSPSVSTAARRRAIINC